MTPEDAFVELTYYTLEKCDAFYIHQLIVDAFGAQTAAAESKPIRLVFSLIGLYLVVEKGYTGREVQRVHMVSRATGAIGRDCRCRPSAAM